mmetsp:Transcript_5035/g.12746  ORF Transcript_5035/g.12746 Transcript_5035/m.12746 type:complete len:404 (-) Transcript_5035:94-1305(-)
MDEEDGRLRMRGEKRGGAGAAAAAVASYEKVALVESDSDDINAEEAQSDSDEYSDSGQGLRSKKKFSKHLSKPEEDGIMRGLEDGDGDGGTNSIDDGVESTISMQRNRNVDIWHKTLIPDRNITLTLWNGQEWPIFDDGSQTQFVVKLLKFVLMTFLMISLVHVAVRRLFNDYDRNMTLWDTWMFEGDLIVRDCIVFFVVGRMWKMPGVDHLAFVSAALVANIYYESQNYMWFLQHSLTLFEMHCKWPWQLWVFVAILIPSIGSLVLAHVVRAYRTRILVMKLIEMAMCIVFFMLPMLPSNYFHLHHWYAGWLLGMHCNMDIWWSRLAMAYCWGMYINGIAVYGRDPVLTCKYSFFLTYDQNCPYISCYLEALQHPKNDTDHPPVQEMVAADWRNCSSTDYIP